MATLRILMTLFALSIIFSFPMTPAAIPTGDLDAVLLFLRSSGHTLFANAISTSDLLFDLLSLPSLTLFAPTDPALFALDMTQTPPFYLSTLRLHALPLRLSWSNLLLLPNNSSLSTLLNSRDLFVTRGDFGSLLVGGVQVVMPGLYYSSDVAVHGLAGILTFRSPVIHPNGTVSFRPPNHPTATIPPVPVIPRIPTPAIHTIVSPSPAILASSPSETTVVVSAPVPGTAVLLGYSPAISPDGHELLTGKPIKRNKSKHMNCTHCSAVNGTVSSPPVTKIPRIPTNRRNRTYSSPLNGTVSSSPVNHTILSPSRIIPASSPIDRPIVVSPPVHSPAPEPAGLHGYSPAESQEDRNVIVSPQVLTPAPGPAGLCGYSPAESPDDRDALTGNSSGFLLWTETSPSPAPMTTDLMRSWNISEAFADGEMCTIG